MEFILSKKADASGFESFMYVSDKTPNVVTY